jgi:hypothetical protein
MSVIHCFAGEMVGVIAPAVRMFAVEAGSILLVVAAAVKLGMMAVAVFVEIDIAVDFAVVMVVVVVVVARLQR